MAATLKRFDGTGIDTSKKWNQKLPQGIKIISGWIVRYGK
jgi:hypothetical protein